MKASTDHRRKVAVSSKDIQTIFQSSEESGFPRNKVVSMPLQKGTCLPVSAIEADPFAGILQHGLEGTEYKSWSMNENGNSVCVAQSIEDVRYDQSGGFGLGHSSSATLASLVSTWVDWTMWSLQDSSVSCRSMVTDKLTAQNAGRHCHSLKRSTAMGYRLAPMARTSSGSTGYRWRGIAARNHSSGRRTAAWALVG